MNEQIIAEALEQFKKNINNLLIDDLKEFYDMNITLVIHHKDEIQENPRAIHISNEFKNNNGIFEEIDCQLHHLQPYVWEGETEKELLDELESIHRKLREKYEHRQSV